MPLNSATSGICNSSAGRRIFLNAVEALNDATEATVRSPSWITAPRSKLRLHFVLKRTRLHPRLIKDGLPCNTTALAIWHNSILRWLQQTRQPWTLLAYRDENWTAKRLTRLVVSGAPDNLNVVLDGKTIAEHEVRR
jgi:hypothetical protein